MKFGRGCHKPIVAPHLVKLPFVMHPAMASAQTAGLPDAVDFRVANLCPPVKNQGAGDEGTGSCEGHSCITATQIRCAAVGKPLAFKPSEADPYRGARSVERARTTPSGQPLPQLQDEGAQTEDAIAFLAEFGIRPRKKDRTSDGRDSDCEVATINDDETLADLEQDAERLAVFPPKHAIDPSAPDAITQCRAALAALIPLRVDFYVDTAFEMWTPGGAPVPPPNENDPTGGGHAVVIVGYRKRADGTYEFLLLNSWGTNIAEAGYWWVSEGWLRRAWGITPWDVSIKEAA